MRTTTIVLLCCLVACGNSSTATDDDNHAAAYRLQSFAMDPFEQPLGDWSEHQNARYLVVERFGEPLSVTVFEVPDRTSDAMVKEHVYEYDGARFRIGESDAGDRSWIVLTEVTGNAHALKYGLKIGSKKGDMAGLFGPDTGLGNANPLILTTNTQQSPPGLEPWHGGTIDVMLTFESERLKKIVIMPSVL